MLEGPRSWCGEWPHSWLAPRVHIQGGCCDRYDERSSNCTEGTLPLCWHLLCSVSLCERSHCHCLTLKQKHMSMKSLQILILAVCLWLHAFSGVEENHTFVILIQSHAWSKLIRLHQHQPDACDSTGKKKANSTNLITNCDKGIIKLELKKMRN